MRVARERVPRRTRLVGVLALLLGAPVFAELVQSYLPSTGAPAETLFVVVFLAPLYGGAALLIREIALRTGRGWRGRLLLAAAFGVLMPTWVDLSLWTPQTREEIELWGDELGLTTIAGISAFAVTSWVVGHVLMSICAPLVIVESLLPAGRDRSWLGPLGLAVLVVLGIGVAVLIHVDEDGPDAQTTTLRYAVSLTVALALVAAAFTRLGRPLTTRPRRGPGRPLLLGVAGFVLMAMFDLAPVSWAGVAVAWLALVLSGVLLVLCAASPRWSQRHLAVFAFGGVLERTMVGFLVPTPVGADAAGKLARTWSCCCWCWAWGCCFGRAPGRRTRTGMMTSMTERSLRASRADYVVAPGHDALGGRRRPRPMNDARCFEDPKSLRPRVLRQRRPGASGDARPRLGPVGSGAAAEDVSVVTSGRPRDSRGGSGWRERARRAGILEVLPRPKVPL